MRSSPLLLLSSILVLGCGGSSSSSSASTDSDSSVDSSAVDSGSSTDASPADAPVDSTFDGSNEFPAFRPDVPQLLKVGYGVLARPVFVPVYFNGDTAQATLDPFVAAYAKSPEWTSLVTQYGIAAGTAGKSIPLTDAAPIAITYDDVPTWLVGKLDGTHAEFGPVDATTLGSKMFLLYYPASTIGWFNAKSACPSGIYGWHSSVKLASGARASYAVILRCDTSTDSLTSTTSYSMVAGATDVPVGESANQPTGWSGFDSAHLAFGLNGGEVPGVVACFGGPAMSPAGLGHMIAPAWSNAEAAAYRDPCVPRLATAGPYFNSAPVLPDSVTLSPSTVTKGVSLTHGDSKTIDVQLFSENATSGAWTVKVVTGLDGVPANATYSFDTATGKNGDVLHLTITANAGTGSSASIVALVSTLGTERHPWVFPIVVQ